MEGNTNTGIQTPEVNPAGEQAQLQEQKPTPGAQLDEFLKGEGMQAEFDRRVTKALKTQEERLTGNIQEQINTAVAEALKVSKMTSEQKAQHEAEQAREALAKREAEITKRELRATAKETLAEKGLPANLADAVNYTDANSVTASIEALEKAFQTAVQGAVDARLTGGKAPTKAQTDSDATLEQKIMAAMKGGVTGFGF